MSDKHKSRPLFGNNKMREINVEKEMRMNANIKRYVYVFLHIIMWGIVFAGPFFPPYHPHIRESGFILMHFIKVGIMCCFFYANYFLLIDRLLFKNSFTRFFVLNLLFILACSLLTHFLFENIGSHHHIGSLLENILMVLRNSIPLLIAFAFSLCIKLSLRWLDNEKERERVEKLKSECELRNLKNQLNPHFLINTLNNIYVLISLSDKKAQEAVLALSKLLRYILNVNECNTVPLAQEVEFLKNYIELMKLRQRNGGRVSTNFNINNGSTKQVAPLLHISLIENAFKHGVSPDKDSEIEIDMNETSCGVNCIIRNTNYPKTQQDRSGSGIGLEQLSKRLEAQYKGKYTYKTEVKDGYYMVELNMDLS